MHTSYVKFLSSKLSIISDFIKYKLAPSFLIVTVDRISQHISCKVTSVSSSIITLHDNKLYFYNRFTSLDGFKHLIHIFT